MWRTYSNYLSVFRDVQLKPQRTGRLYSLLILGRADV